MRILVSAGPTVEPIDGVRFLSNRSSGRMGAALAAAALVRGHEAFVVHGPLSCLLPEGCPHRLTGTAREMLAALQERLAWCDALVMAAAVCDVRPARPVPGKADKSGLLSIACEPNVDVLKTLCSREDRPFTVAYSLGEDLETGVPLAKLAAKGADWIVYNSLESMDSPRGAFGVLDRSGAHVLPCARRTKEELAAALLDLLERRGLGRGTGH